MRPSLPGEELGVQYPRIVFDQRSLPAHYYMFYEGLGMDASGSVRTTLRLAVARNPVAEWGWEKVGPVFPRNSVDSTSDGALLIMPRGPPHYLFYSSLNQNTGINMATTHNMINYTQVRTLRFLVLCVLLLTPSFPCMYRSHCTRHP